LRTRQRRILLAAQLLAAVILFYFIGRALANQWAAFRAQPLDAEPRWLDIAASGVLVLGAHVLLVQTWRLMLRSWGAEMTFWTAARVWSVSNLGKYIPGKIWQITAMAAMATRAGVSAVVSTGSALLGTIINIACGIAIVLVLGWQWIDQVREDARIVAIGLLALSVLGLLALPFLAPRLNALAARFTGRLVAFEAPPTRIVFIAIVGNLLAWLMYGVGFMWLVSGVLGESPGSPWQYIAVYAASYVAGYLVLFLPGGIGVREGVMAVLLTSLALATPKQALLVAGASRIWITLLEIVPGLLFVAHDAARRNRSSKLPSDVAAR
jgi:Lysylphosphatidylglycerol synthase TM region